MLKLPFFNRTKVESSDEVEALVEVLKKAPAPSRHSYPALSDVAKAHPEIYKRVTEVKGLPRGAMAVALLERAKTLKDKPYGTRDRWIQENFQQMAGRLVSAKGSVDVATFPRFVEGWIEASSYWVTYGRIVAVAEDVVAEHGMVPEVDTVLRSLLERIETREWGEPSADERKQIMRIRQLLEPERAGELGMPEEWQAPFRGPEWAKLVEHAATAKSSAMSERWAKAARALLQTTDTNAFLEAFARTVEAVNRTTDLVDAIHSDMLRGLAWMVGLTGTPRAASLLSRLARAGAHKIEGFGPRSQKGFSGAVGALERMGTFESLAELSNARNRIKAANLNAAVAAALSRAAAQQNLPLEELEEMVVATYGLELPGVRTETVGDVEARLEIVGTLEVALRWFRNGKEQKTPPADAKELAKEFKAAKKEIESALTAQRSRLEGLMMSGRTLPYPQWRTRYLDHPLLANMVRRLVWRFIDAEGERLGIAPDGEPQDVEGRPLEGLGEETQVRLWHPIHAGVSAIEAWRERLVQREIAQPFKQAYREIYLLTAAEERTNTYSNRFAAHILKQHQMAALARGRGWRYALRGYFDGGDVNVTLDLPAWGLIAEYFVQEAEMGGMAEADTMTPAGIATYVVTDQVRFNDGPTGGPVPLDTVPPIVFSEVLRDVDLFVGVASVGNDPQWQDQGERTGFGQYWRQVSFGDLSATAETRKAALERLLPRLAIGKVSRIEGRFLVVQGKRKTYKIHLGSGNILMLPNDQYLCIVPGSNSKTSKDRVYLPFEGDGVLAIILSKAMMLMDDDKITDPTILRQL